MAVPQMNVSMQAPLSSLASPAPDPEVAATAKRRPFSSHEQRRILAATDRCTEVDEIGALLRREGLDSSQLATWRKQRAATERAGLEPQKCGRNAVIFPRNSGHPRFLEKSPLIVGLQPTIAPRSVSQYPLARSH